jgi:hypothetical protein
LAAVGLREIWPDEAVQFTPWLAIPENLNLLGETLGMQLAAERTEAAVGAFSADIIARNTADNSVVVAENQLEQTDHTHLGQILTYLAGLDAKTVIWIARRIRDEHRAAVEWLNTNTTEIFRFFAVEVEFWKIGESLPAPRFNIVVKPNDWVKLERAQQVQSSADSLALLAFWTGLKDWMWSHNSPIQIDRPARATNIWIPILSTPFVLSVFRAKGRVGLFVRPAASKNEAGSQEALDFLETLRPAIVASVGSDSATARHPELSAAMPSNPENEPEWPSIFEWLANQIERYSNAIQQAVEKANVLQS